MKNKTIIWSASIVAFLTISTLLYLNLTKKTSFEQTRDAYKEAQETREQAQQDFLAMQKRVIGFMRESEGAYDLHPYDVNPYGLKLMLDNNQTNLDEVIVVLGRAGVDTAPWIKVKEEHGL